MNPSAMWPFASNYQLERQSKLTARSGHNALLQHELFGKDLAWSWCLVRQFTHHLIAELPVGLMLKEQHVASPVNPSCSVMFRPAFTTAGSGLRCAMELEPMLSSDELTGP